MLPKEYGGNGDSVNELAGIIRTYKKCMRILILCFHCLAYWKKKVESYRDWFLEEDNFGTNEKLRPGKPKNSENIFGTDGSFRKLEVD